MSDFAELVATLEQVRSDRYPQLSADLVRRILEVQLGAMDDRNSAVREIRRLVSEHLEEAAGADA
jgi:hypothetical protein